MALDKDLEPWLRLRLTPGLGDASVRGLLRKFGTPQQVLAASLSALCGVLPRDAAEAIHAGGAPDAQIAATAVWLDDASNHIITLADDAYPRALLQIADPPSLLYVKGLTELLNHDALAIVGSRSATPQGLASAEAFAKALSDSGLTIISGLAAGVDAAAHRGGMAGRSRSIAVVGTGLDIVYPARHRDLAHQLASAGALVSEFPLGTPALPGNFPRRNRIISGMSRGCLVVEAAQQSGSLITARLANEQGREVFAMPGSIHSPLSKGCHQLIRQGAKLVECAQDILEELRMSGSAVNPQADPSIEPIAQKLLLHLGFDPCDIDSLCTRSGLDISIVSAQLLRLEMDGYVAPLPGGLYQRLR
jgi:DNA processing protein